VVNLEGDYFVKSISEQHGPELSLAMGISAVLCELSISAVTRTDHYYSGRKCHPWYVLLHLNSKMKGPEPKLPRKFWLSRVRKIMTIRKEFARMAERTDARIRFVSLDPAFETVESSCERLKFWNSSCCIAFRRNLRLSSRIHHHMLFPQLTSEIELPSKCTRGSGE